MKLLKTTNFFIYMFFSKQRRKSGFKMWIKFSLHTRKSQFLHFNFKMFYNFTLQIYRRSSVWRPKLSILNWIDVIRQNVKTKINFNQQKVVVKCTVKKDGVGHFHSKQTHAFFNQLHLITNTDCYKQVESS